MKTLKKYKEQQMQDLEFAKGYEAIPAGIGSNQET